MSNRKTIAFGGALALLAGAIAVHACGPFFPLQLLDNRAGTLSGTPNNSFAYEASHLVTPGDHLLAPEAARGAAGQPPADPAKAVMAGLTPAQIATLAAMAKAADGDAAYAMGAGLPDAQRLYAAADVDYQHALSCANAARSADASRAAASSTAAANAVTPNAVIPDTPACAREPLFAHAAARLDAILALPGSSGAPRAARGRRRDRTRCDCPGARRRLLWR